MRITVHPSIFVFAESVTNDMNMDKNNRKLKAKTMRRRILASVCAVAIALLQIAVIGTIGTEEVSAATQKVEVKAKTDNYPITDVKKYDVKETTIKTGGGTPVDPEDPTSPPTPETFEKGVKVSDIKKETGLSGDIDIDDDAVLVLKNGTYHIYMQNGDIWEEVGTTDKELTIDMGDYNPVKSISVSLSPTKLTVGGKTGTAKIKVNYKNDIFDFKGSDAKYLKNVKWTGSSNVKVTPASGGLSATVKAIKKGAFTVTATPEGVAPGKATGNSSTTTTTKKTTTKKVTTRYTTRHYTTGKYTTYRARTGSSNTATSTGTTAPIQTYAPDRTITVKEVFLGQQIQEDPVEQPTPADMMEDGWDDMNEDTSDQWAEDEYNDIEFGPMAGSAAVAVAACGAGAVGRIRRFKVDTAAEAVKSIIKRG